LAICDDSGRQMMTIRAITSDIAMSAMVSEPNRAGMRRSEEEALIKAP
jgi:hypothetical protein